jgi:hypothetical protein
MPIALLDWMVEGYIKALERLDGETRSGDAGERETFLPLFEALNWAASIDLYFSEAGKPVENDLLTAVRFARNRVHHQWARALTRYDSPGVPMIMQATSSSRLIGPPPGFWWCWVETKDLPSGHSWPEGEAAYSAQLAGKRADVTLADLLPVLEALRS